MKKKYVWPLLIFIILGVSAIILVTYGITSIVEVWQYDMNVKVSNKTGIKVDNDKLWFGTVTPGSSAWRDIVIENRHDMALEATILASGDIMPFVKISDNKFILEPGEKKTIKVYVNTDPKSEYGEYTGQIEIIFKRKGLLW